MIIVRFCGGLGNQMFQYAMYLSLKHKYPNNIVKAEIFHYNIENEHNGFELPEVFNLDIDYANKKELRKVYNGIIFDEKYSYLSPKIKLFLLKSFQNKYLSIVNRIFMNKAKMLILDDSENRFVEKINYLSNGNWYLRGFWQRTDYFEEARDYILNSFDLTCQLSKNDLELCDLLLSGKCIAVHVRGGDFISPKYNLCDFSYYNSALKKIKTKLPLIVFTDDVNYARSLFQKFTVKAFVSHDVSNSKIDMYMMSLSKKIILSNSTFSFWGAYLSKIKHQFVVAPKYASLDGTTYRLFPSRDSWLIIDNKKER